MLCLVTNKTCQNFAAYFAVNLFLLIYLLKIQIMVCDGKLLQKLNLLGPSQIPKTKVLVWSKANANFPLNPTIFIFTKLKVIIHTVSASAKERSDKSSPSPICTFFDKRGVRSFSFFCSAWSQSKSKAKCLVWTKEEH